MQNNFSNYFFIKLNNLIKISLNNLKFLHIKKKKIYHCYPITKKPEYKSTF